MTRPGRHREIKQINKEMKYLQNRSSFSKLFDEFGKYNTEEIQILANGQNPDEELQKRFNDFKTLWDRGVMLAKRLEYLKGGFRNEPEKNIPTIQ